MRKWYYICIDWDNGELLRMWDYDSYDAMSRRAFKFLRSTNAVCTCMRIKEGTEEDFKTHGSV